MLLLHTVPLPVQIRLCSVFSCLSASVITVLKLFSFLGKTAFHICHFKPQVKYVYLLHLSTFIQFTDHFYLFGALDICHYCERRMCMEHWLSEGDSYPLSNIGWILTVSSEHTCWALILLFCWNSCQNSGSPEISFLLAQGRGLHHRGYSVHPKLMVSCQLVTL